MQYVELTASKVEELLGKTTGGTDKKPSRVLKTNNKPNRTSKNLSAKSLAKARDAYEHCREGKKALKELNLKIEEETEKLETRIEKLKKKGEKEKIKELKVKLKEKVAKLKSKWDKAACKWFQEHNDGRKG